MPQAYSPVAPGLPQSPQSVACGWLAGAAAASCGGGRGCGGVCGTTGAFGDGRGRGELISSNQSGPSFRYSAKISWPLEIFLVACNSKNPDCST
jgi:hypothetical protein